METAVQFLPLLLIAMVVAGVTWWTARRSARTHRGVLVGFGGWLLLLAIGQTLAALKQLGGILQTIDGSAALSNLPNGNAIFYAELVINSALIAFTICVTVVMWRKYPSFPRLFTWQWLIALAAAALEPALVSAVTGVSASALYSSPAVVQAISQAVATGLWVWYVRKSVRVRNTFTGSSATSTREAGLTATL